MEDYVNDENGQIGNKKNSRKIFVIILIIVLLLVLGTIWLIYSGNLNKGNNVNNNVTNNVITTSESDYKVAKWNNVAYVPTKSFYKEDVNNENYYSEVKYYNIATLENGETVVKAELDLGIGMSDDTFIIDKNNNIKLLAKYSNNKDLVNSDIQIDEKQTIPEIFPEEDITYKGQTLVFKYHSVDSSDIDLKATKVGTTKYGDLYEYIYYINNDFYVSKYYIRTPDKMSTHYYDLKNVDIYNDDKTLKVNWDDNTNRTLTFQMPISSCGNGGERLYVRGFNSSMGVKVGTITINNKPLYKLTDENLLQQLYNEYYYDGMEGHSLSFAQYKNALTNVVYQDDLGNWIILSNDKYSHAAECGKPVIYLYPEKDTYVNVEVGANVTVSDPQYDLGGWKNVLARPDGTLTYKGKEYDSLFWEGKGNGLYPNVDGIGKVVTQDNLISTIKNDLEDQGLNQKEIADFVDFWKDNLPKTPYVKLTWLTTNEMNILAPIKVSPRPDTVIRVFLDAKGLNSPIKLEQQKLTKIERKGFTLVEWGGLLLKK